MNLFVAEHFIKDKAGWDNFFAELFQVMGDKDMTIDKAMALPMFGGNECLATLNGGDDFHMCIWKCPESVDMAAFQTFIDGFTQGYCTNKVFPIDAGMGLQRLTFREYLREFINMAQGRGTVGFRDAPAVWYVHHHVTDKDAWDNVSGGIIANGSKLATPSEMQGGFEEGYGGAMTCFLGEKDAMCLWSTPEDVTQEEYKAVVDRFTNGSAINSPHRIDPNASVGFANISCDQWSQDMHAFAKAQTKTASEVPAEEGASQPIFTQ
jgi:hypothetical protein